MSTPVIIDSPKTVIVNGGTTYPVIMRGGVGPAGVDGTDGVDGDKGDPGAPAEIVGSRASLKALIGMSNGDGYHMLDGLRGGMFIWRTGDYSAQVTADPYEGIFIASTSVASTAGVWERLIEKRILEAEWWLPDVLPDDCEVRLNTIWAEDSLLVSPGDEIRLPQREYYISSQIRVLVPGLVIVGYGPECLSWGADGTLNTDMWCVHESGCVFFNVWGGGTYGTSVGATESPVFHTFHEFVAEGSYKSVNNTTFINCGAIDAMVGLRLGYCTQPDLTILQGHNNKVIGFRAFGCKLMGLEVFNQRGAQISDFTLEMGTAYSGDHYGIRWNSNMDCVLNGGRVIGLNETSGTGLMFDIGATSTTGHSRGRDNIITNVRFEQWKYVFNGGNGHEGALQILNCSYVGRTNNDTTFFYAVPVGSTLGRENKLTRLIIRNCVVHNATRFAHIGGDIGYFQIEDNEFISNDHAGARPILIDGQGSDNVRGRIRRNYFLHKQNAGHPVLFQGTYTATNEIEIDDNDMIPSSATGKLFETYGPGSLPQIRTHNYRSNRSVAASRWTDERPSLALAEYT